MVKRYEVKVENTLGDEAETNRINKLTEELKFQEALIEIWKKIAAINKEIAEVEPWKLEKEGKREDLDRFLKKCYERVLQVSDLVGPYLPDTSKKIKSQAKTLDLVPIFEKF